MKRIDGLTLKRMILAGAHRLEEGKEEVNSLNVFPVPDGDTGTNMTLTLQAACEEVNQAGDDVGDVAKQAATGSLMGARGNSGVILSQLFRGFASACAEKEVLTGREFAEALQAGVETAYGAVLKPVEGTILTVAREAAEAASKVAAQETDLEPVMKALLRQGEATLRRTPEMLSVLREAGVVDAGGKGLLLIYRGYVDALCGTAPEAVDKAKEKGPETVFETIEVGPNYYCTEFLVRGSGVSVDVIRKKLDPLGDSLIAAGSGNIVKIHVHTSDPGEVLSECLKYGELDRIKIDNMRIQHQQLLSFNEGKEQDDIPEQDSAAKIGVVTVASGSGIIEIFKKLGAAYVVEGGQTMNPSTDDLVQAVKSLGTEGIIVLPNNRNIIMAANQAAEMVKDHDVRVIPTRSIPEGIAAMMGFQPDGTLEQVLKQMEESAAAIKTGQVTFSVRDSTINGYDIKEGDILGLQDGKIASVGKSPLKVVLEVLEKTVTCNDEIITVFFGEDVSKDDASRLRERIEERYPDCEVEVLAGGQPLYYFIFSVE